MYFLFYIGTSISAQVSYVENNGLKFDATTNCQIRYNYYPNMCSYYDKLEKVYIYKEKGQWLKNENLPTLYGGYSLFTGIRVEITDYDDDNPQTQLKSHKKLFPYNKNGHFTYATVYFDF